MFDRLRWSCRVESFRLSVGAGASNKWHCPPRHRRYTKSGNATGLGKEAPDGRSLHQPGRASARRGGSASPLAVARVKNESPRAPFRAIGASFTASSLAEPIHNDGDADAMPSWRDVVALRAASQRGCCTAGEARTRRRATSRHARHEGSRAARRTPSATWRHAGAEQSVDSSARRQRWARS